MEVCKFAFPTVNYGKEIKYTIIHMYDYVINI